VENITAIKDGKGNIVLPESEFSEIVGLLPDCPEKQKCLGIIGRSLDITLSDDGHYLFKSYTGQEVKPVIPFTQKEVNDISGLLSDFLIDTFFSVLRKSDKVTRGSLEWKPDEIEVVKNYIKNS